MDKTITVLAQVDHGKTSFMDCILSNLNLIPDNLTGVKLQLDTREDEKERGVTLKLGIVKVKLQYENLKEQDQKKNIASYFFIDTPGHKDIQSLLETSSILSDTFVLVLDYNNPFTPRLCHLTKYLSDKSILFINKYDIETEKDVEKALKIVEYVNSYCKKELFSFERGNILIGSCKENFCLSIFSKILTNFENKKPKESNKIFLNKAIEIFHKFLKIDFTNPETIRKLEQKYNFSVKKGSKNIKNEIIRKTFNFIDNVVSCIENLESPEINIMQTIGNKEIVMQNFFSVYNLLTTPNYRKPIKISPFSKPLVDPAFLNEETPFVAVLLYSKIYPKPLHFLKILTGKIRKNLVIKSFNSNSFEDLRVTKIYLLRGDDFIEMDYEKGYNARMNGIVLVELEGEVSRRSILYEKRDPCSHILHNFENLNIKEENKNSKKKVPFYLENLHNISFDFALKPHLTSFLVPIDAGKTKNELIDELKKFIKKLSLTEVTLKCFYNKSKKIFKFITEGKIQFEKILHDLEKKFEIKKLFIVSDDEKEWSEDAFSINTGNQKFLYDSFSLKSNEEIGKESINLNFTVKFEAKGIKLPKTSFSDIKSLKKSKSEAQKATINSLSIGSSVNYNSQIYYRNSNILIIETEKNCTKFFDLNQIKNWFDLVLKYKTEYKILNTVFYFKLEVNFNSNNDSQSNSFINNLKDSVYSNDLKKYFSENIYSCLSESSLIDKCEYLPCVPYSIVTLQFPLVFIGSIYDLIGFYNSHILEETTSEFDSQFSKVKILIQENFVSKFGEKVNEKVKGECYIEFESVGSFSFNK